MPFEFFQSFLDSLTFCLQNKYYAIGRFKKLRAQVVVQSAHALI